MSVKTWLKLNNEQNTKWKQLTDHKCFRDVNLKMNVSSLYYTLTIALWKIHWTVFWNILFTMINSFVVIYSTVSNLGIFSRNRTLRMLPWHIIMQFSGLAEESFLNASFTSERQLIYLLPEERYETLFIRY